MQTHKERVNKEKIKPESQGAIVENGRTQK
jgi:hypothetical protein